MNKPDNNKRNFLKSLDKYLLIHKPVIWSTRIHAVLFYSLLFMLFLAGISFLAYNDPRNEGEIYSWIILLSVISALAFIFWLIYLLRFNVFKRYGKWGRFDSLKTFAFYFLTILVFVSWPFFIPVIQSARANMAYTTPELVKDVNDMNTMLCQLERDSIDLEFDADTLQLTNQVVGSEQRKIRNELRDYTTYSDTYFFVDTPSLHSRLLEADSVLKLNDSLYITYKCPDYQFVYTYDFKRAASSQLLGSMQLYNSALKRKTVIDRQDIIQKLDVLLNKYSSNSDNRLRYSYNTISAEDFHRKIVVKYKLEKVNNSLSHIGEKKYRWDDNVIPVALRAAYYITLFFSVLLFIYRHSTRKTFFLSLLTGVVLLILTFLFIAMSMGENYSIAWYLFYFTVFSLIAASIFFNGRRNVVAGISLNLSVFLLPLVPFVIVFLYYEDLRQQYYRDTITQAVYYQLTKNEMLHCFLAEAGGFILLLIAIATIAQKAYRKWYASPEQ